MSGFVWNLLSFIIAIGILVAVHEWGHFYVARRCGVKVERFSIGFGKRLWSRRDKHGTEFTLAAIPLGGYVQMLDSRVQTVPEALHDQAFNHKPLSQRMAIVAAGPIVNFIFAILALWLMYVLGVTTIKPMIGSVSPDSIAAQGQIREGSTITQIGDKAMVDWQDVNLELIRYIGEPSIRVVTEDANKPAIEHQLDLQHWQFDPDKQDALSSLGIALYRPLPSDQIAVVAPQSAAGMAGLQTHDRFIAYDQQAYSDWQTLVAYVQDHPGQDVLFTVERAGQVMDLWVTIGSRDVNGQLQGYLGVSPSVLPLPDGMVFTRQYGPLDSLFAALQKTIDLVSLSFDMLRKLITGHVSVENLSGPISIAQGAGASAGIGLAYFLSFLALISVNLGVINLLPLPMLDGGHLLFYVIEGLRGKPLPDKIQEVAYRVGASLVFVFMMIAILNDLNRL